MLERGPTQLNIPRDFFYGEIDVAIPKPIRIERGPAVRAKAWTRRRRLLAAAKFPVIVAGGGVIMSDGIDEARALAEHLRAPVVTSYLHNDAFPQGHALMCGPLGYQGSKAAMKLIAAGRCRAGARHPPRAVRDPAAARHRLLAEERQDHPGRHRSRACWAW